MKITFTTLLFICLLAFSANAQFTQKSTSVTTVGAGFLLQKVKNYDIAKRLENPYLKNPILVIHPLEKNFGEYLEESFKEVGYTEVVVIQIPRFPKSAFMDSVKTLCKEKNVKMTAQIAVVEYSASFPIINLGQIKRGFNINATMVEWDTEKSEYIFPAASITYKTNESLKPKFDKLFNL